MNIEPAERAQLLQVARRSIIDALSAGAPSRPTPERWPSTLAADGASFVTLTTDGALRGCCGSVVATRPLVEDVWSNAKRTAFDDPRFPALRHTEVVHCALAISVLGPLQEVTVDSEHALVAQLRPGVDGLLLRHGDRQATFLPKVWEKLPEAPQFVRHLKHKMGLPADLWDDAMVVRRYVTVEFSGQLDMQEV